MLVAFLLACGGAPVPSAPDTPSPSAPTAAAPAHVPMPELEEVSIEVPDAWQEGPDAYERAVASGAPTLVYFSTDWCGYCKRLDKQVLHTAEAERAMELVHKVHVNPEKSSAGSQLYRQFRGNYVPYLLLVTRRGEQVEQVRTPDDVDGKRFAEEIARAMKASCDGGATEAC